MLVYNFGNFQVVIWNQSPTGFAGREKAKKEEECLALLRGLRIWSCPELWCESQTQLELELLWLWRRLTAAVLIWPLVWGLPYATRAALKKKKIINIYAPNIGASKCILKFDTICTNHKRENEYVELHKVRTFYTLKETITIVHRKLNFH